MTQTNGEYARLTALRQTQPQMFAVIATDVESEFVPLWLAVLAQAVEDALSPPRRPVKIPSGPRTTESLWLLRKRIENYTLAVDTYLSARDWLTSPSCEPCSFRWVCETVLNTSSAEVLGWFKVAYPGLRGLPSATCSLDG